MAALLTPQNVDELMKVGSLTICVPNHDLSLRVLEARFPGSRLARTHNDQYRGPRSAPTRRGRGCGVGGG